MEHFWDEALWDLIGVALMAFGVLCAWVVKTVSEWLYGPSPERSKEQEEGYIVLWPKDR